MSGSAYYDDCSCGQRFHESALGEHWPHLESQNQALQERANRAEGLLRRIMDEGLYEDATHTLIEAFFEPTQETDRPDIEEIGRGIARDFGKTFDILAKADRPTQETDPG